MPGILTNNSSLKYNLKVCLLVVITLDKSSSLYIVAYNINTFFCFVKSRIFFLSITMSAKYKLEDGGDGLLSVIQFPTWLTLLWHISAGEKGTVEVVVDSGFDNCTTSSVNDDIQLKSIFDNSSFIDNADNGTVEAALDDVAVNSDFDDCKTSFVIDNVVGELLLCCEELKSISDSSSFTDMAMVT